LKPSSSVSSFLSSPVPNCYSTSPTFENVNDNLISAYTSEKFSPVHSSTSFQKSQSFLSDCDTTHLKQAVTPPPICANTSCLVPPLPSCFPQSSYDPISHFLPKYLPPPPPPPPLPPPPIPFNPNQNFLFKSCSNSKTFPSPLRRDSKVNILTLMRKKNICSICGEYGFDLNHLFNIFFFS
jgi:hypothetical protein